MSAATDLSKCHGHAAGIRKAEQEILLLSLPDSGCVTVALRQVSGRVTFIVLFTLRRFGWSEYMFFAERFFSRGVWYWYLIQPNKEKETMQSSNLQAKCTIRLRIFSFREETNSFEEATEDEKRALAALGSAEALDEVLETMEQILSAEGQNVVVFFLRCFLVGNLRKINMSLTQLAVLQGVGLKTWE